ncbi:hypothetical protein [Mesorhizobium sp. M0913]|uniref:hypothetical protein n=1 Tax=Mesorhizobium sp. M0913 TaxID=2957026 RepID=UPI00333D9606
MSSTVRDLAPRNRQLFTIREEIQRQIDLWHRRDGAPDDLARSRLRQGVSPAQLSGFLSPCDRRGRRLDCETIMAGPELANLALQRPDPVVLVPSRAWRPQPSTSRR